MFDRFPCAALALLWIAQAACCDTGLVRSPVVSVIEPLSGSTALVRWDSVDAGTSRIQVWSSEHAWSGFEMIADANSSRGWEIISGLEQQRSYHIYLRAVSTADTAPPGQTFTYMHSKPSLDWVFVPAGDFVMGSTNDDEAPPHRVMLSSYLLSATEITNRNYLQFCVTDSVPLPEDPGFNHLREYVRRCPDYPVVNVSWTNAIAYCNYLSRGKNAKLRLPTEAEWEYSASFAHGEYPWGDNKPTRGIANFASKSVTDSIVMLGPVPVMSYPASPPGLYDLAGNAWEWCSDWYGAYIVNDSVAVNPTGPESGIYKVVRGGSWADSASVLCVRNRGRLAPSVTMSTAGFRVARSFPVVPPIIVETTHAEKSDESAK